jgi:hypothetical protein
VSCPQIVTHCYGWGAPKSRCKIKNGFEVSVLWTILGLLGLFLINFGLSQWENYFKIFIY